ncbi:MAG TPA: universal stress protein [Desulfopila sp.]|nr:universal stress protein [Desulfopila sp.]
MLKKPEIKKILYCTDLGKHTSPVFMNALAQAEKNNAPITVIHVVEPMTESAKAVVRTYMSDIDIDAIQREGMDKIFASMKKRIDSFLREKCGKSFESAPIKEILIVAGRPSEEILNTVKDQGFDLIVLGKSSGKVLGHRVMGSTARRVNRLSRVPVLVVPNR